MSAFFILTKKTGLTNSEKELSPVRDPTPLKDSSASRPKIIKKLSDGVKKGHAPLYSES